jgi:hypothetical protein
MGMEVNRNDAVQDKPKLESNEVVGGVKDVDGISKEEKETILNQRKIEDKVNIENLRNELTLGKKSEILKLRQKRDNLKGILFTDTDAREKIAQALGISEDDIDIEGLEGVRKYKNDGDQMPDMTLRAAHHTGWTEWKLKNGEILYSNPDGTLGVKDTSN